MTNNQNREISRRLQAAVAALGAARDTALGAVSDFPNGFDRLPPEQLGLDAKSFAAGVVVGMGKAQEIMVQCFMSRHPGRGGSKASPELYTEQSAYVNTVRAATLIGRSISTMHKWSASGGSGCMTVVPYSSPSDKQVVLWKVAELRAFVESLKGQEGQIVPRATYRARKAA